MKKVISIFLAILIAVTSFAGCGNRDENEATQKTGDDEKENTEEKKDFVFGTTSFDKLDPANEYQGWTTQRYGVGETLFVIDDNMKVQPLLAENYELSEDQMTWTIKIRDGVKFHNGKDLDGEAVKADLERLVEMNPRAADQLNISYIESDGNKVMITTKQANPTLINSLCDPYGCIIDVTSDCDPTTAAVGTGPYVIKEVVPDVSMYLEANKNYWGGTPKLDSLTVKAIADIDTLAMAMQNGELDAANGISYDMLDTFKDNQDYEISQAATTRVYMLYFNDKHEFMDDPNFRKALCMMVDKEKYADVLINGAGTPTKSAFPSSLSYGDDEKMTDVPNYDPEAAKAILEENGYIDSDGDGFLDKDGKKVSLRIVTYGRTGLPQSAQALQSALQDIGIDANYEQFDAVEQVLDAGDYDISAYACVTTPTGDPYSYLNSIAGVNGNMNFSKYDNPEVQKLLGELAVEFDSKKRTELAIEIQQIMTKDSSYCFMFHLNMFVVFKNGVKGIKQSPVDYYTINVNTDK